MAIDISKWPPTNPYIPFVSFKIAGSTIDFANPSAGRPQYLVSMSIDMQADNVGTWSITLFDMEYDTIEKILVKNWKGGDKAPPITMQYGYNDPSVQSPVYSCIVLDYQPEFTIGGQLLHISGSFSDGEVGEGIKSAHSWPTVPTIDGYPDDKEDMTIDDIVKAIIKKNSWVEGNIEACKPHLDRQGLTTTKSKPVPQQQDAGMSDLYFIKHVLCPSAIASRNDQSGFYIFFNPGTKELHFQPKNDEKDVLLTISYPTDPQHRVTSFQLTCPGGLWQLMGNAKTETLGHDPTTGDVIKSDVENPATSKVINDGAYRSAPSQTQETALKKEAVGSRVEWHPANNQEQMNVHNKSMWTALNDGAVFNLNMTMLGHPDFMPLEVLAIKIYKPPMDAAGQPELHYASGKFLIQKVTHQLDRNGFLTTIEMTRNAASVGPEPVEGPVITDPVYT